MVECRNTVESVNVLQNNGADKPNPSQKSGYINNNFNAYLPEVYVQDIWSRRSQCRTNGQSKQRFSGLSPACYVVVPYIIRNIVLWTPDPDPN